MVFNIQSVFIGCLIIWNAVITYFLARMIAHYNRLIGNAPKGTLKEILDTVVENEKGLKNHTDNLENKLAELISQTQMHIQKVGLVRFNPFADTGGSQSFTLAFMDGKNNGIVMTSLYTRSGGRWYIKHVRDGKGVGMDLSKEEQTAVSKAKFIIESKG
jgi:hypothetical protein